MVDTSFPSVDEIRSLCGWLTGNPDMAGKFRPTSTINPKDLYIAKYHHCYIENLEEPQRLSETLAKLSNRETNDKVVEKLIFKGIPKIGKTRAVYEKVIKRFEDFLVFTPSPTELGRAKLSEVHLMPSFRGLKMVLFLDDLDEFVVNPNIDLRPLISRLEDACQRLLVVATLRTGVDETEKIMDDRRGRELLHDIQEIRFTGINDAEAEQLARAVGKENYEFDDITPGSVVLGLNKMRHRLGTLGTDERAVCKTLKLLSSTFIFEQGSGFIKTVSDTVFKTSFLKGLITWSNCIKKLKDNDLIIEVGNSIKAPHRDFYENVYGQDYTLNKNDLDALEKMFVNKKDTNGLLNLGNSFAVLWEDYTSSVRCYDRASKIEPKRIETWINRGISLAKLDKHEHAAKSYERAIDIDPKDATAWYKRGNSLIELGRYKDAVTSYDRTLGINPKDADAWFNRGVSLVKQSNHRDAISSYDRALEIDPKKFKAWVNKGICFTEMGMHEDAIKSYNRALEMDPKNIFAWSNMGARLDHLGKHEDALKCYNRALHIEPVFSPAIYNKGLCLHEMGKISEAKEYIEKARKIDPNLPRPSFKKDKTGKLPLKAPDKLRRS